MPWLAIQRMYLRSAGSSIWASAVRGRTGAGTMPLRSIIGGSLLVARELAVVPPVRLLHVLKDDVDLVGGGLADLHHGFGDGMGQLALLLVGAAGVPLNGDIRHGLLPRGVGAADYPMRAPGGQRSLTASEPSATVMDTVALH